MSKFDKILVNVYGVIQLGCILGLAGIAFKRNKDAYDASCKLIDAELKNIEKDIEIYKLKYEINSIKGNNESENEGEA